MANENAGQIQEHASKLIVLYDGACGLCERSVQFLLKRDKRQRLLYAPLQGATATRILERQGISLPTTSRPKTMYVVVHHETPRERIYMRTSGTIRSIAALGGLWRLTNVLLIIPPVLRDIAYRLIAKYRYKIFGEASGCLLADETIKQRFLP